MILVSSTISYNFCFGGRRDGLLLYDSNDVYVIMMMILIMMLTMAQKHHSAFSQVSFAL